MSYMNALLGAMKDSTGLYNDQKSWENQTMKDVTANKNTQSATKLNNQKFDFNNINNETMIQANKIANQISQQSYDQKNITNPLDVNKMNLTNAGLGFDNTSKQAKANDDQGRFDAVETIRGAYANNPSALNDFNAKYALGSSSWGRTANAKTGNKQIIGSYNTDGKRTGNGMVNSDGSVTPVGVPQGMQAVLEGAIQEYADNNGSVNPEFDTSANRNEFNERANQVYQYFISQGQSSFQAEQSTKNEMMGQVGKDGDWLSKDELVYTPNSGQINAQQSQQQPAPSQSQQQYPTVTTEEEYLALPSGTTYIGGGQIRVKQ